MKTLFCLLLLATISTQAQEPQLSFSKMKKVFKKSDLITQVTFNKYIKDKNFVCYAKYSEDRTGELYPFRFISLGDKIIDRFSKAEYKFQENALVSTKTDLNGFVDQIRIADDQSLVIYSPNFKVLTQYAYCSSKTVTTVKSETIVGQVAGEEILGLTVDANGNYFVTQNNNYVPQNHDRIGVLTVFDKNFKKINEITAEELFKKAGIVSQYNYFSSYGHIKAVGNDVYLFESYRANNNAPSREIVTKFNASLKEVTPIEIKVAQGQSGLGISTVDVDHNGNFNFFRFGAEKDRSSTTITSFNSSGQQLNEVVANQFRTSSRYVGTRLTSNLFAVAGSCTNDFKNIFDCPERNINYAGVAFMNDKGVYNNFISEDAYYETLGRTSEVLWAKGTSDGGLLVAWSGMHVPSATIFKYDQNGKYVDSWGFHAKNAANKNIGLIKDSQKNQFNLVNDELYYFESNLVFKFKL